MNNPLLDPFELRVSGFEALAASSAWANAVRFIQQYEPSRLNYTAQRDTILPDCDAAELARRMGASNPPSTDPKV